MNCKRLATVAATFLLLVTAPRLVRAACATPGYSQVVIYQDPNFSGICRVLEIGNYPSPATFGPVANNAISSLQVGAGVRAVLYDYTYYPGGRGQADYEGGKWYTGATMGAWVNDQTSSILVEANNGHQIAFQYSGYDWPSARHNYLTAGTSDCPQGLAHDSSNWFVTRTTWIFQIPFSYDLASATYGAPANRAVHITDVVPAYLPANYNHFGDPDVYGPYLFVPVESSDHGMKPALAVFRTSDLGFVAWSPISEARADSDGYHAAWVAIDSVGNLFTSNVNIGAAGLSNGGLQVYWVDLNGIAGAYQFLWAEGEMALYNRDWSLVDLRKMQGGDLSTDEQIIYLSNSYYGPAGGDGAAIRAFDLSPYYWGVLQARSENSYGPFNFQINTSDAEEPEGIDYFDVTGLGIPAGAGHTMPNSQLHVLLYSNFPGNDVYWLKHYNL